MTTHLVLPSHLSLPGMLMLMALALALAVLAPSAL